MPLWDKVMRVLGDEAKAPTLVINVAVIGLAISILTMASTGGWYMSQQSTQGVVLADRLKSNQDAVKDRLDTIISTLNERVLNSTAAITERQVRYEKDLEARRELLARRLEQVDKRDDDQSRFALAIDQRLTRLEAQREFSQTTGVRR